MQLLPIILESGGVVGAAVFGSPRMGFHPYGTNHNRI